MFDKHFYNEDIEDIVPQFDVDNNFAQQLGSLYASTQSDSTNAKKIEVSLFLSLKITIIILFRFNKMVVILASWMMNM